MFSVSKNNLYRFYFLSVYSLLRRSLEVIFVHYDAETVKNWDMPATLKDLLNKVAPLSEFGNYKFFENVTYYDLQKLGFQEDLHEAPADDIDD